MNRGWFGFLWVLLAAMIVASFSAPTAMAQSGGSSFDPSLFPGSDNVASIPQTPVWSKQGTTTWQRQDGSWATTTPEGSVQDQSLWGSTQKKVKLAGDEAKGNVALLSVGDPEDPNHLSFIGASGNAKWELGVTPDGVQLAGELKGRAYLAELQLEGQLVDLGDKDLGLELGGKVDAFVGAEAGVKADVGVSTSGVKANVGAEAFAGAKATGEIPLSVQLCQMAAGGKVKGEVSYGAGAAAKGSIEVDWSNLTVKVSGQLAATLGLGGGVGTEVEVDLSALVSDPGAVADCLLDKVVALGEAALDAGEALVDTAADVAVAAGGAIVNGAVATGEVIADGATALANGVGRATDAISSGVSNVASGLWGFVSSPFTGGCP